MIIRLSAFVRIILVVSPLFLSGCLAGDDENEQVQRWRDDLRAELQKMHQGNDKLNQEIIRIYTDCEALERQVALQAAVAVHGRYTTNLSLARLSIPSPLSPSAAVSVRSSAAASARSSAAASVRSSAAASARSSAAASVRSSAAASARSSAAALTHSNRPATFVRPNSPLPVANQSVARPLVGTSPVVTSSTGASPTETSLISGGGLDLSALPPANTGDGRSGGGRPSGAVDWGP
ncbi:MAG: hypothetical protein LBV77_00675 [Candidatus Adiutrix intracellularis]|nr:hypothetical protein [Candidatus Adiutrix intracellularis]